MNYQEAKVYKANLEAINDAASEVLQAFDSLGKSSMGMTPDHVKAMPECQDLKKDDVSCLIDAKKLLDEIKEHLSDSRRSCDEEFCVRIQAFLENSQ